MMTTSFQPDSEVLNVSKETSDKGMELKFVTEEFHTRSNEKLATKSGSGGRWVKDRSIWKGYYPLDVCLRPYEPPAKKSVKDKNGEEDDCSCCSSPTSDFKLDTSHKCTKYCVHGINILNRNDMEIEDAKKRLLSRREKHLQVEKRRRHYINDSIDQLESLLPLNYLPKGTKNPRGYVLQQTLAYIQQLKAENETLKQQSGH